MSTFLPSISTLSTIAKGAAATAAGVGTLSAGLIYYGQNFLIYPSAYIKPPSSSSSSDDDDTPSSYGLYHTLLTLPTSDKELLKCYFLPQRKELPLPSKFSQIPIIPPTALDGYTGISLDVMSDTEFARTRPTVIMFHGNGGTAANRIPIGMLFQQVMRCNVLGVEYRGYGQSTGAPSEEGFKKDAEAALNWVLGGGDERVRGTQVVLYGQSIGGAVAIDLASRFPEKVSAVILENTFISLPMLVPHVLPYLAPFRFLCHQKWESAAKVVGPVGKGKERARRVLEKVEVVMGGGVGRVDGEKRKEYKGIPREMKILLLSGAKDTLVPPQHMHLLREVFEARPSRAQEGEKEGSKIEDSNETTRWAEFELGTHNDTTAQRGYWNVVGDFVADIGKEWRERERGRR